MDIYLVTQNQGKLMAAARAFEGSRINLLPVEKDYPEIQADSSLDVARFTATQVAQELNVPAIREDHSLYITSLNMPGPYVNYMERKVSTTDLQEILKHTEDRTGYFEIAAVYAEPNGFTKEFVFRQPIVFSKEARGSLSGGWNTIIILDGETRTLAEYPEPERLHIWDKNFQAIAAFLKQARST